MSLLIDTKYMNGEFTVGDADMSETVLLVVNVFVSAHGRTSRADVIKVEARRSNSELMKSLTLDRF